MRKLNSNVVILIVVIVLAAVLRIWNLTQFPAGFNADEAALGYNAYSLLLTGKDEYGTHFPLAFKSFGDFKPGLYVYMAMPFVALFGLNELAVRLPSAILGLATVLLLFFLARRIFKDDKVGLIAAFLLAISPWHLHFSRGAWETNVATFFITLGVFFFIKTLENSKFFLFTLISFLVAMYTYQSPRLVVPVMFISLVLIYHRYFLKNTRRLIIPVIVAGILTIPLLLQFTSGAGSSRFSGLSFLSDGGPKLRTNELISDHKGETPFETKLLHNKLTAYGPNFLGHYLDHFAGNFLFINGDPLIRNKVPETGQFYLIESVFLVLGLIFLIKKKVSFYPVLLVWLLAAPIASAMTYQTPHALRALNMVIPLMLLISLGVMEVMNLLKGKLKYLGVGVVLIALSFEFVHYLDSYYNHYPQREPLSWEYGFSQMVGKLSRYEGQYQKVVITDMYDQPYILVLFYKKYDPAKFQPQAHLTERDKFNFGTIRSFDNYEFRQIDPDEVKKNTGVLYIGTTKEIPPDANVIDKVYFPNGEPAFVFAKS